MRDLASGLCQRYYPDGRLTSSSTALLTGLSDVTDPMLTFHQPSATQCQAPSLTERPPCLGVDHQGNERLDRVEDAL
jgi:hypothetical protein